MSYPGYLARRVLTWFLPTRRIDQISRDYWDLRWRFRKFIEDVQLSGEFLRDSSVPMSLPARLWFIIQCLYISLRVESSHTQGEILAFARMIMLAPPGVVVEAGCFKGGSTAKFSLIAEKAGRNLMVFDSFQGIPGNTEPHEKDLSGYSVNFEAGSYAGSIDEVKANISRYGRINLCRFYPGLTRRCLISRNLLPPPISMWIWRVQQRRASVIFIPFLYLVGS